MAQADFDNYHFFKFSTFMIHVTRMKAQAEHIERQREAVQKAREGGDQQVAADGGKSLFDVKASSKTKRAVVEKVPFQINIQ